MLSRGGRPWTLLSFCRGAQILKSLLQNGGLRLESALEFLMLRFKGVNALRELLPILLIPLAQTGGRKSAHQSYDRSREEKTHKPQGDEYDGRITKHHRYDSVRNCGVS